MCFLLVSFSAVSGQYAKEMKRDTVPVAHKVPDSVMSYPDTLIIKIPAALAPTFAAYMNGTETEVILAYYKELMRQLAPQIRKQYVKKPTKK